MTDGEGDGVGIAGGNPAHGTPDTAALSAGGDVRSNTAHLSHHDTATGLPCCDWVSGSAPYLGPPVARQEFTRNLVTGELRAGKLLPLDLEGSFSAKVQVWSTGTRLYFSGNYSKFLKGENFTGSPSVRWQVEGIVRAFLGTGRPGCAALEEALASGDVRLSRIDLYRQFEIPAGVDPSTFIRDVGSHSAITNRKRQTTYKTAAVWGAGKGKGAGSRRSQAKLYDKHFEMFGLGSEHMPTCSSEILRQIFGDSRQAVRFETTTRNQELKRLGALFLSDWDDPQTYTRVHEPWYDNILAEGSEELAVSEVESLEGLKGQTALLYEHWKRGGDCRGLMPRVSKATFYRARKTLLALGVNIDNPPPAMEGGAYRVRKVVTLREILSGREIKRDVVLFDRSSQLGAEAAEVVPLRFGDLRRCV